MAALAAAHENEFFAGLTDAEYGQLADLLAKLGVAQDLTPGVQVFPAL